VLDLGRRDLLKGDLYNRLPLGVAWTNENKLLFSLASKEEAVPPKIDDKAKNIRQATANALVLSTIYEATAEGEPQRLFSGYNALPSPDGKWLSFIGQMDVNQPDYLMPHICLFDRKTLKRYTGLSNISNALWSPDSRQLVIGDAPPRRCAALAPL
jgi:hypothetical protein